MLPLLLTPLTPNPTYHCYSFFPTIISLFQSLNMLKNSILRMNQIWSKMFYFLGQTAPLRHLRRPLPLKTNSVPPITRVEWRPLL